MMPLRDVQNRRMSEYKKRGMKRNNRENNDVINFEYSILSFLIQKYDKEEKLFVAPQESINNKILRPP